MELIIKYFGPDGKLTSRSVPLVHHVRISLPDEEKDDPKGDGIQFPTLEVTPRGSQDGNSPGFPFEIGCDPAVMRLVEIFLREPEPKGKGR